jgi:phosphoribosylanthranilate isomerase
LGPLVKICGLTNARDAEAALEFGADVLGFVFEPTSPRFVPPEARGFIGHIDQRPRVAVYGPFEGEESTEVDMVQATEFKIRPSRPSILSLRVRPEDTVEDLLGMFTGYDRVVLDAFHEGQYGGTGQRVDWEVAEAVVAQSQVPVILAGGLTPENVAQAIRFVRPAGVDVSSGVETAPGQKDHAKMQDFIAAVRQAL